MFLSRVEIPWALFRNNPYKFHCQLWRLFPDEAKESRSDATESRQGFLFRIEENKPGRPARFLVQSRRLPAGSSWFTLIGSREFHPQPVLGQRLAFILTANPIKTIVDTQRESKRGKTSEKCRVPLIHEEEQRGWLSRKLANAGETVTANVRPHPPMYFRKGHRAGKLATATFDGVLQVSDPAHLTKLLENGVGPAKGFGCGLLLVRRV